MERKFNVIGIGEILWDLLPEGRQLGGAPTNFAYHARQLGMQSAIISSVGLDDLGNEILEIIDRDQILNFIDTNDKPTGTVSVEVDNHGIPEYIIHENVAWDYISPSGKAFDFAANADAVCFGTLAQRSETSHYSIQEILNATPEEALRVFDINMRQTFYNEQVIQLSLKKASVLKINDEEILIFAEMFGITGDEYEIMHQIRDQYDLQVLALTKGAKGSWLIDRQDSSFIDTPEVKVADTVGAGDSFTAGMVTGLLRGMPLKDTHQLAVDISAFVCTQKGGTPTLPAHLLP